MSKRIPSAVEESCATAPAREKVPVPAPPRNPLARPRLVEHAPRSARREHEVQRVIRELAALAERPRTTAPVRGLSSR